VQTKILRRETSPEEYRVYRAGLEWGLTDSIVIEKADDLKSTNRWRDNVEPYHHQVTNLITFCRRLPVTLLADDVGLGKTISAGLIISELISRSRLSKILIVCPKLLTQQWQEELRSKFSISSQIAIGQELVDADPDETGAVITTYNSARLHLDNIPQDRFQMLVLDEAHKLRNLYGVDPTPQVATRFRKALEERRFRFVLMLTATPIQNRLWDIYSLVDLLTVARGHQNPFGSEGVFARKFIADKREQARKLKPEAQDEFRSIVYGYMSRIRRGDANLHFPDRVVQMHRVDPTAAELQLIQVIAKPIQKLNRLTQISILQALTSSPHALTAQLTGMARNGTVPQELATIVQTIVARMPTSAKLRGLGALIDKLKRENRERWRMVVFTGRLETQTTIQIFLEQHGLKVGIINGSSGARNQATVTGFRKDPPDCHVIVSTEAGSEGVNLQVANVLVNYDLPWNPMIVEQRIGRVQRLASKHASVAIFNVMLRGTFEEYIVGRLMEKLQMASHAIGDIEALLEASGISGDDESGITSFDEKIRQLVMSALTGADVELATRKTEESIANAKSVIEREEKNINEMLGGMDGAGFVGPRAPSLPTVVRSMGAREFVLAALSNLGARLTPQGANLYLSEQNGGSEYVRFDEHVSAATRSTLYAPGASAFLRLVDKVVATGIHAVEDVDLHPAKDSEEIAARWIQNFGGTFKKIVVEGVLRCFEGTAVVRVRATVAHDSYERLVEISCVPDEHNAHSGQLGLDALPRTMQNPKDFGLDIESLSRAAVLDGPISEFSRFYLERRAQEIQAASGDERKKKKLDDEFTPRLEMTLVALEGKLHRRLQVQARYTFDTNDEYKSALTISPNTKKLLVSPPMGVCHSTGKSVPTACLNQCEVSKALVLQHLLVKSDISGRHALPSYTVVCSLSSRRVLTDEAEVSAVSGRRVASSLLRASALSGKRAEATHFVRCDFTSAEVLSTEVLTSEISGKRYRLDEGVRSVVTGKMGHKQEFITCAESSLPVAIAEAEQCAVTGKFVKPGVLESCTVTQKRVLPSELLRCAATGKRALKSLFVTSSLGQTRILEEAAIRSATGKFCAPVEAKPCLWSGRTCHPDDLRICGLTRLPVHFEFATTGGIPRLQALDELLGGVRRTSNETELWDDVAMKVSNAIGGGRCKVEAAVLSPDKLHLAICAEVRTMLGFRVRHVGSLYSIEEINLVGRLVQGRRAPSGWLEANS